MSPGEPETTKREPFSGCAAFLALFVMPFMSIAAATMGLWSGATLTLRCERLEPRRT
ncbi:MAG: hypothetical protein M3Q89_12270 [Verrucomicrobiota bacterium]|nr:hypothetical protein [Verrucomicrobiota bacterium]